MSKSLTKTTNRATLLDHVSATDAARLEEMHADILQLDNRQDVPALRKAACYFYEIIQMPITGGINGAADLSDAGYPPYPFTEPLTEKHSAFDAIHHSLIKARALADVLNTASLSDEFESMRDDTVFNTSSLIMGYIEDALAKLEKCTVSVTKAAGAA